MAFFLTRRFYYNRNKLHIGNKTVKANQPGIEQRIAAQLKQRRLANGLSLADLAERSGVSRAMISKVERSAASPTAALLGRLCNGLGLTLSSLIANAEESASPLVRAKDQTRWQDPATGLIRTMISPDLANSPVEIVRIDLPPGASVSYDPQRYLRYDQHVVPIKGHLHLGVGDKEYQLGTWDCLLMPTNLPLHFHNRGPVSCRYLVIVKKAT
jgi:transcriptional regulator with XRE-family HTH domain